MDQFRLSWSKVLLLVSGLVCLVYLLIAAFEENFTAEWFDHQRNYAQLLSEKAQVSGNRAGDYPIEIRQVYLKEWDRVDRCVTCHVGIDNPAFRDAPQPLSAHSGDLLKHHPADRFGCTICHQGQGRATDKDGAHGYVPHWDEPLLVGDFVQATCTKCHYDDVVPQAPVFTRGKFLLRELGCIGCHQAGQLAADELAGPRLTGIGSKVSRKWLHKWLANPKGYLPAGRMPHYDMSPEAANALAAYLMTFHSEMIDTTPESEGDFDVGGTIYRESQCIVCHVTKVDYAENLVGGTIGPDLRKIGNKVNRRWLMAFLKDPHAFLPNTKMPRFHFSDQQILDLSQFATEEWLDYDLLEEEEEQPDPPPDSPSLIAQGKLLFTELDCAGCHELTAEHVKPVAPDLTSIGSTPVHLLSFGDAQVRRTIPDFLYAKLKSPKSLHRDFQLPPREDPAEAIWKHLRPTALFAASRELPEGSDSQRLTWIQHEVEQTGVLQTSPSIPTESSSRQATELVRVLNEAKAFNPLKMPDFELSDDDAKALTIALMSLSDVSAPSKRFEVPNRQKIVFNPKDRFGTLERRYRCLSCHSIRGSGDRLASDLTLEGNRVNRQWLYHYLNKPYSMRRMLTIAMPIFHFPEEESRFMADYISQVFVDSQIGSEWQRNHEQADSRRGETLFDVKGCIACHQLHGKGGDVGPSLTTQVPEFPQGTWVGDKLRGEWIYHWLKDPQALLPETIEPNLGLSDQEALDLTAYLLSLRNPEFQPQE